ncbi:efflux transporter outer membrane subunit [Pseudodesulfovibrio sp.]|uniref:efflux transporter outer membrane subunit n=1 Tax=unclassified Pseudodesulfovibrio TaxID=2661612 RepID=UPI003AFFBCED
MVTLLTLVLMTGCTVGPNYRQPAMDTPKAWNEIQDSGKEPLADLKKWWTSLGDPVLNQLIERAVDGNLDVASAQARVREARAAYRQAGGALLPSLDGNAAATRNGYGKTSASATNGKSNYYNSFNAGFDASWELDLFGANKRAREAAKYGLDAAHEDLRSTLLTLIGDVALNYVDARGYQAQINLAKRTADSQRETARLTREKYQVGSSSAVDMDKASADVNNTEANIPGYEAYYAEAVHRLSILLGQPPATLLSLMDKTAPVPVPQKELPAGVPADILRNRPDVRMAERRLAQNTAQIGEAEAARYPDISLSGTINTSGNQLHDLSKGTSIGWIVGPSLSLPIFNGGQLKAAVDIAAAQRDQSYFAYKAAVLTALEDVENDTVALSRAKDRAQSLALAVKHYREAAYLSRLLYQNGASAILDVLDAERSLYNAEDAYVQSRTAITESYIALAKALGGGWDESMDEGKPLVFDDNGTPKLVGNVPKAGTTAK